MWKVEVWFESAKQAAAWLLVKQAGELLVEQSDQGREEVSPAHRYHRVQARIRL